MKDALFLDDFGGFCFWRKKNRRPPIEGCEGVLLAVDAFALLGLSPSVLGLRLMWELCRWVSACQEIKRVRGCLHLESQILKASSPGRAEWSRDSDDIYIWWLEVWRISLRSIYQLSFVPWGDQKSSRRSWTHLHHVIHFAKFKIPKRYFQFSECSEVTDSRTKKALNLRGTVVALGCWINE